MLKAGDRRSVWKQRSRYDCVPGIVANNVWAETGVIRSDELRFRAFNRRSEGIVRNGSTTAFALAFSRSVGPEQTCA